MKTALRPLGISQGVAPAALAGPEECGRAQGAAEIMRLGSNESPFGPSPQAVAAMRREALRGNRYGDPSAFELRHAIALHHEVALENVVVGAGIDDLLGLAVRAYLSAGMPAIASQGAFPTFEMHARGFGAHLVLVPYGAEGGADLGGLVDAAQRAGGGLVFLPNPDNPSGASYAWGEVLAFLDALPDGTLLIHDEAYANFLPQARRFPREALDERMLRMRTFSKEYGMAGLRVGYALGAAGAIAALDAVRLLYGVNRVAQAGAVAALADSAFAEDVVTNVAAGRREYHETGARLGIPTLPSDANFVLFDFGGAARAVAVMDALLQAGIHVRKPPVPPLDRCIRVSVGTSAERARFAVVLHDIVNAAGMGDDARRRIAHP